MALLDRLGAGMRAVAGYLSGTGRGQRDQPPTDQAGELRYAEDYVKFVRSEFERRRRDRLAEELQWRLNLAFSQGDQYYDINTATMSLEETPLLYDWEEREVFNQIAPIYEVRHARLTRGRLIRKVRPASGQQADVARAEISSKVLLWDEQEHDHRAQLDEVVAWAEATGTCFKKRVWNPKRGPVLGVQVVESEDGQATQEDIREGDQESLVVPPFEIYPQNLRAGWREQRSIIHARAYHVDEIHEMFGLRVEPEDVEAWTLQAGGIGARGLGYGQGGFRLTQAKLERHAVVIEFWERPSSRYPQGRLIVIAGQKLLYAGELPYLVGRDGTPDLPFVPFYSIRRPGHFFGDSIITRLIPIQRRYNALRNRKAEYLKRVAIGQPIYQEGSLANEEEVLQYATEPGQAWVLKTGAQFQPRYMEFPSLPGDFDKEEATLLQEFRALSGVSDLAKMSEAPSGVKSGVALSLALEQDETRLSATANNIEVAVVEEGKIALRLYRQFVRVPRLARIANRSDVEVLEWVGSELNSDDIIIEGGSGLGESPAQRRAFVFDLLESGLLADTETGRLTRDGRAKLLEMLEFGHWESASDSDYELQVSAAQRNIAAIKQGQLPQVQPFYDLPIHLQTLHRWMLSQEFEEAAAQDIRIQVAAYQYRQDLLQAMQAQMLAQMASAPPPQQSGLTGPAGPGQAPPQQTVA